MIADASLLGLLPLVISLLHGGLLTLLWSWRSTMNAARATRSCYLTGAIGIAVTAYVMTSDGSQVPGLSALYSLAFMNLVMAFTVPLLYQMQGGRT